MTAPAWTPDMPLRADATDGDIEARADHLVTRTTGEYASAVAREFAAACLAAHPDSTRLDWLADDAGTRWSEVWRKWSGEGPFRETLRAAIDATMDTPSQGPGDANG